MDSSPFTRLYVCHNPANVTCAASTGVDDEFTSLWTVTNYTKQIGTVPISSPVFVGGPKKQLSWQLKVYPKHRNFYDGQEYFGVHLFMVNKAGNDAAEDKNAEIVKAGYKLSLLNANGQPAVSVEGGGFLEWPSSNIYAIRNVAPCRDVITRGLVQNDSVRILTHIWYAPDPGKTVVTSGASVDAATRMQRKNELANDFRKMFTESLMTDFTLSSGNTTYKVHKAVLAARCPVLANMINESKAKDTLKIPVFEDALVKGLIEYIYAGETNISAEKAPEFLKLADKYKVVGLKEDCEYVIASGIGAENVIAVLELAHKFNAQYLRTRAADFFKSNKEEVKRTKAFEEAAKGPNGALLDLI